MKRIQLLSVFILLLFTISSFGQNEYNGKLTDAETGESLIGVSIFIPATNQGTLTDLDGLFTLKANPGDVLEISYIGYETQSITLDNQTTLNIQMIVNSQLIDEIVVIGYGTQKKSDLTGSISSVKSEDIIKVPSSNAIQSLQGKVAGLQILSVSGDPGANPIVRLRGVTTLNNNNPIAVIDGVITDLSQVSQLNPNDIESIEVLKDASATAIYGSRGAAGVIIVTTKKGEIGQNRVQATIERSVESVANKIDVMTGQEFATYLNVIEPGSFNNLDALPNIDWQDEIFESSSPITNASLSVSGASESSNFYFGLGFFNQEGVIPKSELTRLTGKMNLGFDLSKYVDMGIDFSLSSSEKDNAPGVINTALRAWPIDTPFLENGDFAEVNGSNPLASIAFSNSKTNSINGIGNLYANIHFLDKFTYRSSVQFTHGDGKTRSFSPVFFVAPLQQNEMNDLNYGGGTNSTLIFENTLSFNQEIGKNNINAVVGYTTQDSKSEFLSGSTENLLREDPLFWYLNAGEDDFERVSNGASRNTLLSYLGRVNYSYDSRYLFTASLRRDGSSKFGINNRWGNFPSFALGWNAYNEDFFKKDGLINKLKVRASWGIIGNERIPSDAQYAVITSGANAVFGENETLNPGASFDGGGNPALKWEETKQINIGVDLGLWENRVTLELDYYQKQTDDILVPLEPIGYSGTGAFRTIFFNAANVENKGFEWNLTYRNNTGNLSYGVGFLGSTISNNVTNIGQGVGADSLLVGGDLGNGQQVSRTSIGNPIGYFYGYQVEGVIQNQADLDASPSLFGQGVGDLKFADTNNDGILNSDDRTFIGSSIPSLVLGFSAEVGYKSLTLSADIQGQTGNKIYNGKQAVRFSTLNYEDKYNNYWSGEGSTNEDHRPAVGGVNFQPSDYFVEDGSFIRLRSLTLNYDFSDLVTNKIGISRANIYIRATNLLTLTSFSGYSPEIGAGSATDGVIDRGIYPITKVFTLGLSTNF